MFFANVSKAPQKREADVELALFSFPMTAQRFHEP